MSKSSAISAAFSDLPDQLKTRQFGRDLRWHASVGSTNAEALRWASEGAQEGALVGTDHQTAGRGRQGRAWHDSPGHNLLFSIVLRPSLRPDRVGLIPLAAGLAVADGIAQETGLSPILKWPNDVLLSGRKVCGVLMEGHIQAKNGLGNLLVLGIGLNVNQVDFDPEVANVATSVALESGRILPRTQLLTDLLFRLEHHYYSLSEDDGASVRAQFEERMAGISKQASVAFAHSGVSATGVIQGVADNGALRLFTSDGEKHLHAGEITLGSNAAAAS